MDIKKAQEQVLQNKKNHGFNITNVEKEFCLLYGEIGESYEAYRKKKEDYGEELADISIYLMGISEIVGVNLEIEIPKIINEQNNISEDIDKNFCLLYGSASEAYDAYSKKEENLGEKLASIAVCIINISKMTDVNLEYEILHKMEKNKNRIYKKENGVLIRVSD